MRTLFQPESGILTVQYAPNESSQLIENPPRFTWMAAQQEDDQYVLQIASSADFTIDQTVSIQPIPYNLYTPDYALIPGIYYWRYALLVQNDSLSDYMEQTEWSQVRSFTVPEHLPETPLPGRKGRYAKTNPSHPRLWLNSQELVDFRLRVQEDSIECGWDEFYEKSVVPWLHRELVPEPARYPENKRVARLWRQMYMDCQESLYAIRHLSVAGVILQDSTILEKAKLWLLHVNGWDVEGTTSRDYNDEASFRIAGALAWGYDWLYNDLNDAERELVRRNLYRRTEQIASHVIERSMIHQVPYDSHAVRSLSSVLVPCCIAMLHEEREATGWLDYTIEYYAGIYSPWGGEDGGWAEGPLYWTTGMAFVTDAMNLLRKYVNIDLYKRPFFQRTGDFPLYCNSPDTIRTSFGDQSTLGDPTSLKTAFNIRQFAGVTGSGLYQWYYEQVKKTDIDADSKFYNYGWWDFRFDEMLYRYDYPQVSVVAPVEIPEIRWFRDIGWVAMHHRMDRPDEHIMLLTKSSRYGSISHSHGDQNAFLLHAFGEPLAIESGYYVAFGSTMHRNWRRQTISTNSILVDGQGQYAGNHKVLNMAASGTVEEVISDAAYSYVRSNATAAYQENVPYLERYVREIYFCNHSYFVIVDYIDLTQPGKVDWLFHTLHPMKLSNQAFYVDGEKADMLGRFVYSSSGDVTLSQHDQFIDVDPEEIHGLANQWHLHATTKSARSHRLVTLLVPMKKGESKYVSYFLDDQDHGVHIYLTDQGLTRKIEVQKAY